MKKLIAILLALLLMSTAAFAETVQIGTTGLTMDVTADMNEIALDDEDVDEDMIACFDCGDDVFLMIYLYEADGDTAEEWAQYYAEEFGGSYEAVDINGLTAYAYTGEEDGSDVLGFVTESGDQLAEFLFATNTGDTDALYAAADAHMATLSGGAPVSAGSEAVGGRVRLGDSELFLTIPEGYESLEITGEEAADGMVAYYQNADDVIDLVIYAVETDGSVEDYIARFEGDSDIEQIGITELNGLKEGYYVYTINGENGTWKTVGYVFSDGEKLVVIETMLDETGSNSAAAAAIIETIGKEK